MGGKNDPLIRLSGQLGNDIVGRAGILGLVDLDADSFSGSWKCDLTLVNESKLLSQSESRWEGIL